MLQSHHGGSVLSTGLHHGGCTQAHRLGSDSEAGRCLKAAWETVLVKVDAIVFENSLASSFPFLLLFPPYLPIPSFPVLPFLPSARRHSHSVLLQCAVHPLPVFSL